MKKIHIIYNHNVLEPPYKQGGFKKSEKEIINMFGEDTEIFLSRTTLSEPNPFYYDSELIIVEYSFDMTSEEKKVVANIVRKSVNKIKRFGEIDVVISFRRIAEDDLYFM